MESNQVSLTRMMLNISTPQDQGLSLTKGEILKGVVQDIKANGLVMMLLKGRMIEAASEIMVKSGQQLYLMVDEFRNGKAYLKVLTPQGMEKIENASVSANLQDMGIPPKEDNIIMARKLLQHNLPVTQDNLNNLARGLKILGNASTRNLEIAAFTLARGLPLNKETLSALAQYISDDSNPAKLAEGIFKSLSQVSRDTAANNYQAQKGFVSQPSSADVKTPVILGEKQAPAGNQMPNQVDNQVRQGTQTGDKAALMEIVRQDSTAVQVNAEKVGQNIADKSINPQQFNSPGAISDNNKSIPVSVPGNVNLQNSGLNPKQAELFKVLLEFMQINMDDDNPGPITANKLHGLVYSEKEIIRGWRLLQDIIKNSGTDLKNPIINDLSGKIDGLERELTGQKIFNFVSRMSLDNNLNYYYFSFPVTINDEQRLCQLRLNKEPGRKSLKDQDAIRFIVSLDTRSLGMVLFHVNWKKAKNIELQGVVQNQEVCNYLDRNISQLLKGLNNLGYTVSNRGIKIAKDNDEFDNLKMRMEKVPADIRPFSIDVTV